MFINYILWNVYFSTIFATVIAVTIQILGQQIHLKSILQIKVNFNQ
jgi:hypothetical protein